MAQLLLPFLFNGTNGFLVQMAETCGIRCTKWKSAIGTNGTEADVSKPAR
jgi:hypothetical protein